MEIDGNITADQLARECSSHPLIGPEPALGASRKVAREVIKVSMSRKHKHWQSTHAQRQAKGFLKKKNPLKKKKVGDLLNQSRNPAKNNDRVANRTVQFKRTLI